jgi:carboxypeptidase Taq
MPVGHHLGYLRNLRVNRLQSLLGFLRERVHRHGARLDPADLIAHATGSPLSIEPFLRHVRARYGPLHGVSFDA